MPSVALPTSWRDELAGDHLRPGGLLSPALPGDLIFGSEHQLVVTSFEHIYSALLAGAAPPYNPVQLRGAHGVGKTHLVRALCDSLRPSLGKASVLYVRAAEYAQEWIEAIDADDVSAWRERHRSAQLFILDDLEHLAGKELAQDELVRTLDFLVAEQRQVVIVSHTTHGHAQGLCDRLIARLAAGLTLRMPLPELPAREAILRDAAQAKGARVTSDAIRHLAVALRVAPPTLLGAITYLHTAGAGAEIDAAAAAAYLEQRGGSRNIGLRDIAVAAARHFAVPLSQLRGNSRRKSIVAARGTAMWLARRITGASLEHIGDYFGGRDHTTVLHACRRTEALTAGDRETRRAVDEIQGILGIAR